MAANQSIDQEIEVPPAWNWRTTDADEINKRRLRARTENFAVTNLDARYAIYSNFRVKSHSGMVYQVEIRSLRERQFSCECVDFRINGLGTCKHVEAVLLQLEGRYRRLFQRALAQHSDRIDVVPDPDHHSVRLGPLPPPRPPWLDEWFRPDGTLLEVAPDEAVTALEQLSRTQFPRLRISQEVGPWLEHCRRAAERIQLRREYEQCVRRGEWPAQETLVPLYPYQREGMLHLAFTERALLADEMGLGKTIQAIAACALLHRLGQARRVLVVTPASLKTEWEEQIQRFTPLPYQLLFGGRTARLRAYQNAPFFTLVNYEQMLRDALEVNERLRPDVVILDEAQRIKNWNTKTSQAIKRLRSRYAFVLTGTPIENRIDELHSLMDFLNPTVFGPLFRFNREFYKLDDRGRPVDYQNLAQLHERIAPYFLRRRKADVEAELPDRTDRSHFVPLSPAQKSLYDEYETVVQRLAALAQRRPLTQKEQERLMIHLAMMRMVCDSPFILDPQDKTCPKLTELKSIFEECLANSGVKILVFSEWERMLELVRALCQHLKIGYAWHTGSVPQQRRRAEINAFKSDPQCRVFLSTDSGSTGLNLQAASVVINCDLPWNPAKLEQRIARAWRKHQPRAVTVVNLVTENSIEHRMLETLANKQALADGVLDLKGDLTQVKMRGGRQAFLERLRQLIAPTEAKPSAALPPSTPVLPADRPRGFAQETAQLLGATLHRCEERYPQAAAHTVLYVVVERDALVWRERLTSLHAKYFGPGQSDPAAPVQLEVIDRATDEALQRLMAAGLIQPATRTSRPLHPANTAEAAPPPLSPEDQAQVQSLRALAARKLKMARLLAAGDLAEEARASLLEAVLALGRALAVAQRMPEPGTLEEAVAPPLSFSWGETLTGVRDYLGNAALPALPLVAALEKI